MQQEFGACRSLNLNMFEGKIRLWKIWVLDQRHLWMNVWHIYLRTEELKLEKKNKLTSNYKILVRNFALTTKSTNLAFWSVVRVTVHLHKLKTKILMNR